VRVKIKKRKEKEIVERNVLVYIKTNNNLIRKLKYFLKNSKKNETNAYFGKHELKLSFVVFFE
jgi:hypothetical protein